MRVDLALLAAVLFAGGCASSGPYWNREDRGAAERIEMQERIASLEAQLVAAGGRSAALQAEVDALRREVERLRALGGPSAPARSPVLESPESPESPDSIPLSPSRPQIEQSDLGDLAAPANAMEAPPGAADAERALYDRSLEALEQHRFGESEDGFARFLAANPDSDLADNAQFWLGEGALRRGDVAGALVRFRAVVEHYPEGNKVPDALLKIGFCLASLGEPESAATVYGELLERFPETAAAETARKRLSSP